MILLLDNDEDDGACCGDDPWPAADATMGDDTFFLLEVLPDSSNSSARDLGGEV